MTGRGTPLLHWSARRWLAGIHDEIGAAGLAAAAALPGLAAAVDQHAAAVRDSTTIGLEGSAAVAGIVLLAHYGRGVLEQARSQGRRVVVPGGPDHPGWARADWFTLRLVAVCALAAAHGRVATAPPRLELPPPPVQA